MQTQQEMQKKLEALQSKASVRILAMESSCDETAAAIVENGRRIISSVIFSQVDTHALYGGVVPEIASRAHMDACDRVIDQALKEAGMTLSDIDALAVTYGPGLVGALLTGVNCMKGLSYTTRLPLIPVNHIEGHVSANFLTTPDLEPPFVCLVVSGGHSHLTRVNAYGDYTPAGRCFPNWPRAGTIPAFPCPILIRTGGTISAFRVSRPRFSTPATRWSRRARPCPALTWLRALSARWWIRSASAPCWPWRKAVCIRCAWRAA